MKTDPYGFFEQHTAALQQGDAHGMIASVEGVIDRAAEAMYGHRTTAWPEHNIFVYADPGIRSTRILVDDRVTVAVNDKGDLMIRAHAGTSRKRLDVINAALARFNPDYQVVPGKTENVLPVLLYRGESVNWAGVYTLGTADRVEI